MKRRALATLAVAATAAGTAALAASPAQAAVPPPNPDSHPACNVQQDPGGPCNAGVYGFESPYDNGYENCVAASYGELVKYRHQGYRSASCRVQNNPVNSWTVMVLYK